MKKNKFQLFIFSILVLGILNACRKENTNNVISDPIIPSSKGVLVLNEGSLNANNASLDYISFTPFGYQQGVYAANNSGTKLGDVANDMKKYGNKIYIVINNSNKIEVLDAKTFKSLAKINVLLPRNLEVHNGKVYCTAWRIGNKNNDTNRQGFVAVIDTATLQITQQITVGKQPEGIVAANDKIYVANSGGIDGFEGLGYDSTVSVIDPVLQKEVKKITVGINLNSLKKDANENVYVSSRGNYVAIPANLHKIDSKIDTVVKTYAVPVSNFEIWKETLYYFAGFGTVEYAAVDLKTDTKKARSFVPKAINIVSPYGIAIQPENGNILITDASDFASVGRVISIDQNQNVLWEQNLEGYAPKAMLFLN